MSHMRTVINRRSTVIPIYAVVVEGDEWGLWSWRDEGEVETGGVGGDAIRRTIG